MADNAGGSGAAGGKKGKSGSDNSKGTDETVTSGRGKGERVAREMLPVANIITMAREQDRIHESVPAIHSAAGSHVASDGGEVLLAGFVAYRRKLPVSALPQVDYPTIQIMTFYPGRAGPDVMVSSVTAPLERQLGEIPGLSQMTSTSIWWRLGDYASVHAV